LKFPEKSFSTATPDYVNYVAFPISEVRLAQCGLNPIKSNSSDRQIPMA
jgi:hypothetical protein